MSEANARDAGTEHLLRSALRPPPPGGADACPEAGMLAAFVDGELTATEEAALDAHIATCGRCQQTLAVLAPMLPDDVAADAAEGPVATRRSRWFTWATRPRLRWLVPISAAATVAVVFFATRPLIAPDAIAPAIELARADEAARGAAASLEPSKPATSTLADAATPVESERDKRVPEPPSQMLAARIAPEEQAARKDQLAVAPPVPAEAPRAGEVAAAPAAAPPPAKQVVAADAAGGVVSAERERFAAAAPAGAAPLAAKSAPAAQKEEARAATVSAPGGDVRWRFGAGGHLARSGDAGRTWHEQASGVTSDLLAGAAPSPVVCWIVGAGGTVLLTTDGERWERRPFPLSVDLTSVGASSAREAIITTRDGQRFETLDGGLTWSRKEARPLSS